MSLPVYVVRVFFVDSATPWKYRNVNDPELLLQWLISKGKQPKYVDLYSTKTRLFVRRVYLCKKWLFLTSRGARREN